MKPKLATYKECTGCGACVASCAKGAITLGYNRDGHLIPSVNREVCIDCGLCSKICPVLNDDNLSRHDPSFLTTYTSWSKDDKLCLSATSGGVFSQLALDFLKQEDATVFGAHLTNHNTCHHVGITRLEDLSLIIGTKYIQSDASSVYRDIKRRLQARHPCLFCGTPCQVAGLYAYLSKVPTDRLLTIELICHGVPSKLATDFACRHYDADHIVSYRNKSTGHHKGFSCTYARNNGQIIVNQREEFFFRYFGSMDRPSCYRCKYARIERIADISLGDQWGLHDLYPERSSLGSNLVLCNTEKGRIALLESENIVSLVNENRTLNAPTIFMPITIAMSSLTPWLHWISRMPQMLAEDIICMNWRKRYWLIPLKFVGFVERKIWRMRFSKTLAATRKKYNWL